MPNVFELKLPAPFTPKKDYKATHEDYTIKSIVDSSFTQSFKRLTEKYGVLPVRVAEVIIGESNDRSYYTVEGIDYFPMLHQLVSSEMDCDRMDYLLRDSYFCGVSYGKFDLDWITDNLGIANINGEAFLGINERAVATFDDFLLCRFHMFLMVYFHYKAVCLEKVLERYFNSAQNEYRIPADIEAYLEHDDHFLMKTLRNSKNVWAQKVIRNQIPNKIFESFGPDQNATFNQLLSYLESENIDYIKCSSAGRLSKYYTETNKVNDYPIKVIRKSALVDSDVAYMNIDQATDLFDKFSKSHTVNRIHCELKDLTPIQLKDIKEIIKS
jgi:HD superfamily phosphohydrolase